MLKMEGWERQEVVLDQRTHNVSILVKSRKGGAVEKNS